MMPGTLGRDGFGPVSLLKHCLKAQNGLRPDVAAKFNKQVDKKIDKS
jgi:hypothetical protein